ncbi:MAG TPA: transcriptional regulator, partial [Planctomycetota bacterium]|nr:transcriptional regulator [Planctomycetota bacterium]
MICRAIGDPQTTFEKFQAILDHHGLLAPGGSLKREVSLLSIGDHFDFSNPGGPSAVGREGLRLLSWLASHPAEQAILLAGNHDLSRVMELASVTDERFAEARAAARKVKEERRKDPDRGRILEREFRERYPELPTSEVAERDYTSFTEEQRRTIQGLLLGGRLRLAQAAEKDGRPLLLTHAAVTDRELELLKIPGERDPVRIARALNAALDRAVDRVRSSWERGGTEALDLEPLHAPGRAGREGGGLLYHRPSSAPDEVDPAPRARRRFHPGSLPADLIQACGHTGHEKCLKTLAPWVTPPARSPNLRDLRTLRVA